MAGLVGLAPAGGPGGPGGPAGSGGRAGEGLSARSKARKRALDVLYEADLRDLDPLAVLADHLGRSEPAVPAYAVTLVEGVCSHRPQIDSAVGRYSAGWSLERMAAVDRNLLRLGAYELLFAPDVPDAVAIDEAVRLAKLLSGEEAPAFVNGILARVLEEKGTAGSGRPLTAILGRPRPRVRARSAVSAGGDVRSPPPGPGDADDAVSPAVGGQLPVPGPAASDQPVSKRGPVDSDAPDSEHPVPPAGDSQLAGSASADGDHQREDR